MDNKTNNKIKETGREIWLSGLGVVCATFLAYFGIITGTEAVAVIFFLSGYTTTTRSLLKSKVISANGGHNGSN